MKKVVILGVADMRHMTMISLYTDYLEKNQIDYEIICSDRYKDNAAEFENNKIYKFPMMSSERSKFVKLWYFMAFRKYAIKMLKKNQYDFIIVWGENTAVLFADYLKARGNYCVNIRDTTFSKLPFFFSNLKKAVVHSSFSTWCAQRGKELLPDHDYIIVLNQNKKLLESAKKSTGFCKKEDKIHIGAVGAIRYIEETKDLIRAFADDERFVLQFFGSGSEHLEGFLSENGINNVELYGNFYPEQTAELLDKIDVMNVYCGDGLNDVNITLGSPIRFGYATYLYKPSIVSPHTRLSEKTGELNIGFTVDGFERLPDRFYEWYHSLDFETFVEGCNRYNQDFEDSFKDFYDACDRYIKCGNSGVE